MRIGGRGGLKATVLVDPATCASWINDRLTSAGATVKRGADPCELPKACKNKAEIEGAKCQGCGNCASACPGQAISLRTFTDTQERALFHSILKEEENETAPTGLAGRA